jgi:hypothetical protein
LSTAGESGIADESKSIETLSGDPPRSLGREERKTPTAD